MAQLTKFIRAKKGLIAGIGGVLLAVILLLIFLNPANSPTEVFHRYLDCLRSENTEQLLAISYDANFSELQTPEDIAASYEGRFSSADDSYRSGSDIDLLKDTQVRITGVTTPTRTELIARREALSQADRNTARITDIRNICFEVKRSEVVTTGNAEAICVTGKWYIGEVVGV